MFLLRREDIDQTRCRPEFIAAIAADLIWLGLLQALLGLDNPAYHHHPLILGPSQPSKARL